jgi:hypothetical protein
MAIYFPWDNGETTAQAIALSAGLQRNVTDSKDVLLLVL